MTVNTVKKNLLAFILLTAVLVSSGAQTVLVHSPNPGENPDGDMLRILQSAESGIMDALFESGCIAFSDTSDADESALKRLASRTGSDFIISWFLADSGLEGRIEDLNGGAVQSAAVTEGDVKNRNMRTEDLYVALGLKLGSSLVADKW